ncbi:MAG: HAD family hydrolase [Alphaproteobacteria bacterium]|nr:HAD family hydrolase [Alphaproteobacteria bacterium]
MAEARGRGLILDRDGVVNQDIGFLSRIADCRFVDGIFDLVRAFRERGFAIVIATNQSGIGRGLFSEAEFAALMAWMEGEFTRHGTQIDRVYHCPDHPTEGIGRYRRDSDWRKPGPGMFRQAAADLSLDLARSWTIGDKERDVAAGRNAGIGTLVRLDEAVSGTERDGDVWVVPSLAAAIRLLRKESGE